MNRTKKFNIKAATTAFFLLVAFLVAAPETFAREVVLGAGETYSHDGLTVRCRERHKPQPIVLTNCQFWDKFNEVCLYKKRTYRYKNLACVEECQHWDQFNQTCLFATTCRFYPFQHAFVRTTCDTFDSTQNVCRQTKQELIQ